MNMKWVLLIVAITGFALSFFVDNELARIAPLIALTGYAVCVHIDERLEDLCG